MEFGDDDKQGVYAIGLLSLRWNSLEALMRMLVASSIGNSWSVGEEIVAKYRNHELRKLLVEIISNKERPEVVDAAKHCQKMFKQCAENRNQIMRRS